MSKRLIKLGFLSTLSLRRATIKPIFGKIDTRHFYPRSPCGERLRCAVNLHPEADFYPRSPCGERLRQVDSYSITRWYFYPRSPCGERPFSMYGALPAKIFLSTLSLRRATNADCSCHSVHPISIHALLAESDLAESTAESEGRVFLSTLSLRRATAKVHKTVGHFCAYETNFMGIASSC